jgi:tetratricopeptide (TPR) repeat protein
MKEKVSELILSGEYRDAWKLIEEMRREKKHPAFVDLAGAVCLLAFGHVRQAEEWLDSCEQSGPEFYYLDALIHLHARRPEEALLCYTRIIDEDPSDTFADRLIERLRADEDKVQEDVAGAPIERYLPLRQWFVEAPGSAPVRRPFIVKAAPLFQGRVMRFTVLGILLLLIFLGGVFVYFRFLRTPDLSEKLPDAPSQGTIIPKSELGGAKVRFTFDSRAEVVAQYEDARRKILEGRVNEARVLLNEIDLSNAGFELKERALVLKQMIPWREPGKFSDPVELSQIIKDPELYAGVQVELDGEIVERQGLFVFENADGSARLSGYQGGPRKARISALFEGLSGKTPVLRIRSVQ